MSLYEQLQKVSSEEDVKDAYIKALGLKKYNKNLIDIQTKEVWFEAKDNKNTTTYKMFTQLLHYVKEAQVNGMEIPPFLCAIDTEKAAIMKTTDALPLLERRDIKWGKSASDVTQDALDAVSTFIGTRFVSYRIRTHEREFIDAVKAAIQKGEIIRTEIKPANIKQVFDKWVDMIGKEIQGVPPEKYALLFFADIMHDGTVSTHKDLPAELLYKDGQPVFHLEGKLYELGNKDGYRQFWAIYHKPPRAEHRDAMLERRDALIPLDERSFKGAYYTPLHVVDKAYEKLAEVLGDNWQDEYIVWDMCCGVGNLEVKHGNHRNIFMSTLDQADVDVMKATKTCVAATRFQYDYLNDDIADDGRIDYSLTNKIPESLRKVIKSGKKVLVLINPPYAEAMNADNISDNVGAERKTNVAKTKVAQHLDIEGYATRELFVQFLVRIQKEIPSATIGMFSTLKYVNAPNFEGFRKKWDTDYLGGFIVPSKAFDGLKGDFPIGFLMWQTSHGDGHLSQISKITVDVLNANAEPIGEKNFYNDASEKLLGDWIDRPKADGDEVVPLKNAVTPATVTKDVRGTRWSKQSIGCLIFQGSDVQHSKTTGLLSSGFGSAGTIFVTHDNLTQIAIMFSVRRLVKPMWENDRDQFLQPTGELTDEFKNDCLVWMLFNGSNLTASANDLEWNGKKWSIVNHFIPFTEQEVGAPDRFESDFLVRYMKDKTFSPEAQAVLDAGKKLWQVYFTHVDTHTVRDMYKLNRSDVGWYQVRKALEARNESGDVPTTSFSEFEAAYKRLSEKLRPLVYELGFLR